VFVSQHLFGLKALQQAAPHEGAQDASAQGGLHFEHGTPINATARVEDDTRRCGLNIAIPCHFLKHPINHANVQVHMLVQLNQTDTANGCAPSFLDVADPEDRLVVLHSFSKSFLMTGWRLGWLVMPAAMTPHMGKLIEFNTSCASVFTQKAGVVALQNTADITPRVVAEAGLGLAGPRRSLCDRGRRLAALVFCLQRPGVAGARRGAA
jgi:hypothetical protein